MNKIKIPHTYALLFFIIIFVTLLTFVVPAGSFERAVDDATGRTFVVPDSFEYIDNTPVGFFDMFKAIPKGMEQAGYIIFFVLMIGGSFGILQGTGAIDRTILLMSIVQIILCIRLVVGLDVGELEHANLQQKISIYIQRGNSIK
ncbi:MAG: hypothetical protein H0S78_13035 [Tissierellales bacterium]|nr:hypothetical protein [Tissierellales bacterium]